jgi:hypothetical protein
MVGCCFERYRSIAKDTELWGGRNKETKLQEKVSGMPWPPQSGRSALQEETDVIYLIGLHMII